MKLRENEVHIWSISLEAHSQQETTYLKLLSDDEIKRVEQFRFATDKQRFIIARALLRKILSLYLHTNPQDIVFNYTPHKKPYLSSPLSKITFNLSHSGKWVMYAFALDRAIGIDVEKIRSYYTASIAARCFSPDEKNQLMQLSAEKQIEGFYTIWSRKEALVKAMGKGLSFPLSSFSVSVHPVRECINLIGNQWILIPLLAEPEYKATLASTQPIQFLSYWNFINQNPQCIHTSNC